ncbi:hypothetical protein JTE90_006651 [Oedothorax gibbosus]|uniref:Uncharacterized protein n=1 Tax=Oedothorax gibbosus TaxID=931172 RepID=A0AAV6TSB3_9ARAC|nr:hypothetical protein JTE90_006651 [Oedothorax gibbosus]
MAIPLRYFPDIFFICFFFLFPVNLAADNSASLLYCNYQQLCMYNLHTQKDGVVVNDLSDCYAVDYHFEKSIVFWSTEKKIYRSQNGTKTAVVESVESFGIAVDWLSDLVYWTNIQEKSVEVAKLDGSERRTVIKREEGAELKIIVLHPVEGILFWTDVGSSKKIERCDVDGTNRIVIASESLRHPEGLSIDIYGRTIYWLDRELQNLNKAKFDGTQRRVIYSSGEPLHSYFLDVDHHYLYWASGEIVSAIKKENGSDLVKIRTASRYYRGMKVFSHSKQPTRATSNVNLRKSLYT